MPWSWPNTEYSKYQVQHHPTIDSLPIPAGSPLQASFPSRGGCCCTQLSTFPQLQVNQWIESQLPSCLPPNQPIPLAQSQPPSASLSPLNLGLKLHLQPHSITASQCISTLALSPPPSASLSSLDLGIQVYLQTRLSTASQYIVNEWRRVYRDTGVTEVDWAMGSTHPGYPMVDRHHLIFISFGSTQLRGFSRPGSIICCQFLPRLLELRQFFLANLVWRSREEWQIVDGGPTAF